MKVQIDMEMGFNTQCEQVVIVATTPEGNRDGDKGSK
jgi:hypothetical protein